MWLEFNPNPLNKRVGDCAIRAICAAENLSWYDAYDILTHYGRMFGNLPNANDVWGTFLKDEGYSRHIIEDTCPDCYTVADFAHDHPKGTFILGTGSHVVTIRNGAIMDAWDSSSEVPLYYFEREEQ